MVRIVVVATVADGPAQAGPVRLVPPAVERADVNRAVRGGLHAAGAARFERSARRVEPDIDTLHHPARHTDVVLLKHDDPPAQLLTLGDLEQLAEQLLPAVVMRMRLTAEDELNRPLGV